MILKVGQLATYKPSAVALMLTLLMLPAASLSKAAGAQAVTAAAGKESRLPNNVVPTNYKLLIEPQLSKDFFSGTEKITVNVLAPTQEILLNSVDLKISNVTVARRSPEFLNKEKPHTTAPVEAKVVEVPESEEVKLVCPSMLMPGSYEIVLEFNSNFDEKLRGFFRVDYKDVNGVKQAMACTQMEPTDARRMFPCFDEPNFKATYDISTVIDPTLTAISNAPIAEEKLDDKTHKKTVIFKRTPKMSSYLVALIVGNLASSQVKEADGIPIRVWAMKGKEQMGGYAVETAAKLMPYMNKYFGIKYPDQKLDLIAIPDFGPGGMENLGAITFKETALLIDDKTASTGSKQGVSHVVAHEMAHQWFGDLVTTRWWDDIWLNEAFASWMGAKAVDYLHPDWRTWDGFGPLALSTDSLKSTRAIHANVKDPEEALAMFDDITYIKGSAVLRMLERYVGEPVFMHGVQIYMKAHAFGTATTEDLWWAIGLASKKPIPEMMRTWVYQPGYPLVSASLANGGKQLQLGQKPYFLDPPANIPNTKWMIPIALRWFGNPDQAKGNSTTMKLMESAKLNLAPPSPEAGAVVNVDAQGFYRVSYSSELLQRIESVLYKQLNVSERLALLSDVSSLVWAGNQPVSESLHLTTLCKDEEDPIIVPTIVGRVDALRKYVDDAGRPLYQQYVQYMLVPQKKRLGWQAQPGESDLVANARNEVISTLGTYGQHKDTIAQARVLFNKYRQNETSIEPNQISPMLDIVAYNGSDKEYAQMTQLWKSAKTPEAETRNLMMLADFRKPQLVQKTLILSLSDQVRKQDMLRLLSSLLENDQAKHQAWDFIQLHWTEILKKCPPIAIEHIIDALESFDTEKDEKNLKEFFSVNTKPYFESQVARMLENVHLAVRFREKNAAYIQNWIQTQEWKK